MAKGNFLFTSESVTEGHPDKVADLISDSLLDEIIKNDPKGRVAIETFVGTGFAFIAGQVSTDCYVHMPSIVRDTIKEIGYNDSSMGYDWATCSIMTSIDEQSPDIALGVDEKGKKEQGAGDQGMMFGYACNQTDQYMPAPIYYAHKLTRRLTQCRKEGILKFLRPDGKSQVTFKYRDGKPVSVGTVVIAAQHEPFSKTIGHKEMQEAIVEEVIKKTIPKELLNKDTVYYVNPTGKFEKGGPPADTGLTGRKIIVDTYGGWARHGGGCFSGKDPSKVDRSAAYMARYVAKNIVAAGLADECEIQLAYAIGVADPVSVMVDTFGTGKMPEEKISSIIREIFPLKPAGIIEKLDLLKPVYKRTAAYGHFGRSEEGFTWEKLDKVPELKKALR
jgi:S-adenosylmethionine synthetase